MSLAKQDVNSMIDAFFARGGTVQHIAEGERTLKQGSDPIRDVDPALRHCQCGCEGNYTDHTMRMGEGRFADQ